MRVFLRAAALTVAALALLASSMAAARLSNQPQYLHADPGIYLNWQDDQVVIGDVVAGSLASGYGIQPGWIVRELNGIDLSTLSAQDRQQFVLHPSTIHTIGFDAWANPGDLSVYEFSWWQGTDLGPLLGPVLLGLAILAGGWWLLRTGRLGPALRGYAVTLPVATALPLLLVPLESYGSSLAVGATWALLVAGALPLALDFALALPTSRQRVSVRVLALALSAAGAAVGVLYVMANQVNDWWPLYRLYEPFATLFGSASFLRFVVVVLMTLVPGVLALRPLVSEGPVVEAAGAAEASEAPAIARSPRFAGSLDLALGAVTPAVAGISLLGSNHDLWPIVLWLVGLLVARRFGIQPLVRLVQRTSRQRDLVVTATERERARIAGDIHDYALQDLTMLVRRLDAAGDVENASAARDVADRLRAICGDLRLPILDDLGVGPALDWLVGRLEPDAEKLELELSDRELRLTPDAELAFFRVAQEAIANAIHHGAPPISVRYWGGGDWAELIVDDCGAGIAPGAAEAAERTGHMGLMSMSQRAEAIGAELSFGRRPGGGARVHMTWERRDAAGEFVSTDAVGAAEPSPGAQPA